MSADRFEVARVPDYAISVVVPAIQNSYPLGGVEWTLEKIDGADWAVVTVPNYGAAS